MQAVKKGDPRLFVKNGREIRLAIIRKGYLHVREFCENNQINYQSFRQGLYGTNPVTNLVLAPLKKIKLKPVLGGKDNG